MYLFAKKLCNFWWSSFVKINIYSKQWDDFYICWTGTNDSKIKGVLKERRGVKSTSRYAKVKKKYADSVIIFLKLYLISLNDMCWVQKIFYYRTVNIGVWHKLIVYVFYKIRRTDYLNKI